MMLSDLDDFSSENISTNKADVVALQTIKKLKASENIKPEVKENIIENLSNLSVSGFVSQKIQELSL